MNSVIVSDCESFDTVTVIGKSALDVIVPADADAPSSNSKTNKLPSKLGVVIVPPPALVIVISEFETVPVIFCALTVILLSFGVAVSSKDVSNANV